MKPTPTEITECTDDKQLCEWVVANLGSMPSPGSQVLCYCDDGQIRIGIAMKFSFMVGAWSVPVTHWMPIPKPPLAALNGEE